MKKIKDPLVNLYLVFIFSLIAKRYQLLVEFVI